MNRQEFWWEFDKDRTPEAHKALHRRYYSQFVNSSIINEVKRHIGLTAIIASTDDHFNDIQLSLWDMLHPGLLRNNKIQEYYSLSDTVCVAKEAAQQIRESENL